MSSTRTVEACVKASMKKKKDKKVVHVGFVIRPVY